MQDIDKLIGISRQIQKELKSMRNKWKRLVIGDINSTKQRIENLKDKHAGRPIAVLGGGPSLLADMKQLPSESIKISVNHHALEYTDADYMVFLDNPDAGKEALLKAVKAFQWEKITPKIKYCDFDMSGFQFWDGGGSSGCAGVWFADYMGGDPVILCGMDCYQGNQIYVESKSACKKEGIFSEPIEFWHELWRPAFNQLRNPDKLRVTSGPLTEVFRQYECSTGG